MQRVRIIPSETNGETNTPFLKDSSINKFGEHEHEENQGRLKRNVEHGGLVGRMMSMELKGNKIHYFLRITHAGASLVLHGNANEGTRSFFTKTDVIFHNFLTKCDNFLTKCAISALE